MRLSRIVSIAIAINPLVHIASDVDVTSRKKHVDPSDDEALEDIQLDQAKASIDRLVEANDFDPEVSEMMRNVLTLSDTLTREIMVPRTDMICVKSDETLENFLKLCSRSGFSRVPVIGDSVDDLVGVAYLKDAVRATVFNPAASSRAVETISRDPMLVPESKPVDDLFHEMQRIRQHVAVVVDEYGGIAGLVTIEDAIEQIVGELKMSTIALSMQIRKKYVTACGRCLLERQSQIWKIFLKFILTKTMWILCLVCLRS